MGLEILRNLAPDKRARSKVQEMEYDDKEEEPELPLHAEITIGSNSAVISPFFNVIQTPSNPLRLRKLVIWFWIPSLPLL